MTIEFLGHGLADYDKTVGNYLKNSFANGNFHTFHGYIAYVTKSGLSVFKNEIEQNQENFNEIKFFIGVDDNGTSKEALEILINLKIETYIYHNNTKVRAIYHPKIYIFEGNIKNRIILGSSNLTRPGLFTNVEASVCIEFSKTDKAGLKLLSQINNYFETFLTNNNLNLKHLTGDFLQDLMKFNLVVEERQINTNDDDKTNLINANINIDDLFPANKLAKLNIDNLSSIELKKQNNNNNKTSQRKFPITAKYLASWQSLYNELCDYKKKNNTTHVASRDSNYKILFKWCQKQKVLYNAKKIPEEHKQKLEEIDFFWGNGLEMRSQITWDGHYEKLIIYKKKYKTTSVKYEKGNKKLRQLANWVFRQRMYKKEETLSEYRIKKLNAINFIWQSTIGNTGKLDNDEWLNQILKLEDYKKKTGNCNVSQTNPNQEYAKLGKWLSDQRTSKKRGKLEKTRQEMLDNLGVVWNIHIYEFEKQIAELIEYKKVYGSFDVPITFEKNKNLAYFIYRLKTGKIKEKWKLDRLNEIGVTEIEIVKVDRTKTWVTKRWYKKLEGLKELKNKGIDVNIPRNYIQNPKLGEWVYSQKRAFSNNKLKKIQISELIKLGLKIDFINKKRKSWNDMFELISLYNDEHGTPNVPYGYDKTLYNWVRNQKKANEQNRIKKDRFDKLNSINFKWNE